MFTPVGNNWKSVIYEGTSVDQSTLVSLALAGIGAVVWLVRLEGLVKQNTKLIEYEQKRIDILSSKLDMFDSKLMKELGNLRESVARIEGYLKKTNEGDQ